MPNAALAGFADKAEVLEASERYWNPDKTRFWQEAGIPLVIAEREGYLLTDLEGHRLIDVHLNGGTYNLGHRNPLLVAALKEALDRVDIGNHHFPAPGRAALAKRLIETAEGAYSRVAFATSGSEAIDLSIKSARFATGRRRIVSVAKAYHGHTGLSVATGDARFSRLFLADRPDEFVQVPFNELEAMEAALRAAPAAAVIMETIPATYGFPLPAPGYLAAVKRLCEETGALYIADEVQTGLLRSGALWAIARQGVEPDILVTSKGLGGGLYPIGALIMKAAPSAWLERDGFAHMSTFSGSELGCAVALAVLDLTLARTTQATVQRSIAQFAGGLARIRERHGNWLRGIRQEGLIIGLEFADPEGAKPVMRALYERGVWAIFSTLDPSVLQFKPGLLLSPEQVEDILGRLEEAVQASAPGGSGGGSGSIWRSDWRWEDEAAAALPAYGLPPDCGLERVSLSENATYKVTDPRDGRARILRLHRPGYRSLAEIRSELAWIAALQQDSDVLSPAILPTLEGRSVCTFGRGEREQHAVLFEYLAGAEPEEARLVETFAELGAKAATVHRHAAAWEKPEGFTRPTWDIETAIGERGLWGCWKDNADVGEAERRLLVEVDRKIRRDLAAYGRPPHRWGLIHGDMRMANLIVAEGRTYLIDFDDCGFSWHLFDLGCALTFMEHHERVDELAAAWLAAYRAAISLEAADLAAAPALVMLRRLLLVGWFSTHGHAAEARTLGREYVATTLPIAERFLAGDYLRPALA